MSKLDDALDTGLAQIGPVIKPDNGTGLVRMDSARFLLKEDLKSLMLQYATGNKLKNLAESGYYLDYDDFINWVNSL